MGCRIAALVLVPIAMAGLCACVSDEGGSRPIVTPPSGSVAVAESETVWPSSTDVDGATSTLGGWLAPALAVVE